MLVLISIISFALLLVIVNLVKMSVGGIVSLVIAWVALMFIVGAIEQKLKHKQVDHKNAKIKAMGGNKQKLSDRFESKK